MNRAVWQISGGPASRAYAEVFLRHGVALIGPGDAGPWNPERDDDEFDLPAAPATAAQAGGGFVRRLEIHHRDTEGTEMELNKLTEQIIGAAIEVHKAIGPGLLESAYEECLCRELTVRSIPFERQRPLPVEYKGTRLDCGYRLDLLVAGDVVIEIKSVSSIEPIHEAQLLTYLKLGGWKLGLLINFNVPVLKDGIRRRIL